jgi:hypothetical protein
VDLPPLHGRRHGLRRQRRWLPDVGLRGRIPGERCHSSVLRSELTYLSSRVFTVRLNVLVKGYLLTIYSACLLGWRQLGLAEPPEPRALQLKFCRQRNADLFRQVAYLTGLDNGSCPPGYPVGFIAVSAATRRLKGWNSVFF